MKTLILTCSRNAAYTGGYVEGLMQAMASPHFGGWMKMEHESDIARGRSVLMHRAMTQTKFDSFLWVDDDIAFTREDFDRICSHELDIVGGLYVKRHPQGGGVYVAMYGDGPSETGLEEVRYIGTGFLRVTREVIDGLATVASMVSFGGAPAIPHTFAAGAWDATGEGDMEYLSEDYAFCLNARDVGFNIWLDHNIKLGHAGQHTFRP